MNQPRPAEAPAARAGRLAAASVALISALTVTLSARQGVDISVVLRQAGARVAEYFARAQSIMCLEKVSLQRLGIGFGADGPARFVESELRLSWEPTPDNPMPTEAKTLRQVLRVNGAKPRKDDYNNCTTPEQNDVEEQPLSILLPQQRERYTFTFDRRETIELRPAIVLAFRENRKPAVDVSLVEDNEDIRLTLRDLLEFEGHEVAEAADGTQGAELIVQRRPNVALVDIGLPGMDGYEVAQRVRRDAPSASTRLVALTGYGGEDVARKAREAGFDAHLIKPVKIEELFKLLGELC